MQDKSCRAFEKKFHQMEKYNEVCWVCGMTKPQIAEELKKHHLECVRIAFHWDNPDYKQYGCKENQPRNTPESHAHFLRIFQGVIPLQIPVDSETET